MSKPIDLERIEVEAKKLVTRTEGTCCDIRMIGRSRIDSLSAIVEELTAEVRRLRKGDLTPQEFQDLCHNLHDRPECTPKEFADGWSSFNANCSGRANPL